MSVISNQYLLPGFVHGQAPARKATRRVIDLAGMTFVIVSRDECHANFTRLSSIICYSIIM
jgi:hypothetical protein